MTTAIVMVKGPDIYIPLHTGKPELQRFTNRRGILSISSRQHRAFSGRPFPNEWMLGVAYPPTF